MLEAGESILPIDEIEKLLIARNAPSGTHFYRATYYPSWLVGSTLSLLISSKIAKVTLHITAPPQSIDYKIARQLSDTEDVDIDFLSYSFDSEGKRITQPNYIEEKVRISSSLAQYYDRKMQSIDAIDLPSPKMKIGLDGMFVHGDILYLNERRNYFEDWQPKHKHFEYFWNLCYLGLRCMEEKRSLKYLIALLDWF